jgi:hypothetical protein
MSHNLIVPVLRLHWIANAPADYHCITTLRYRYVRGRTRPRRCRLTRIQRSRGWTSQCPFHNQQLCRRRNCDRHLAQLAMGIRHGKFRALMAFSWLDGVLLTKDAQLKMLSLPFSCPSLLRLSSSPSSGLSTRPKSSLSSTTLAPLLPGKLERNIFHAGD